MIVDVGTAHGGVDLKVNRIRRPEKAGAPVPKEMAILNMDAERSALMRVDTDFNAAAGSKGIAAAYLGIAAADFHLCREGEFPVIGREPAVEALKAVAGTMAWRPQAAVMASSGDLAFTYGTREHVAPESGREIRRFASYIRIWNRGPQRQWTLFLDLSVPYPPQKKGGTDA